MEISFLIPFSFDGTLVKAALNLGLGGGRSFPIIIGYLANPILYPMYPNLFYVFKDWFGVEWYALSYLNSFGLMVAIAFIVAAVILSSELHRKEKAGLLLPREETLLVGKPASPQELFFNFLTGFLFGFKLIGLFLSKPPDMDPQAFIFSGEGNWLAGLALGIVLAYLKWQEKKKQTLKVPEQRIIRVWPHDRVGDLVVIALIGGILGAKLFDNLEHWDEFLADPIGRLLSTGGLAFYGGLIVAALAIYVYARQKKIRFLHLADALAPAMLMAYAVGRIGCQVSGDGDWGVYNRAYITDPTGKPQAATEQAYQQQVEKHANYFLRGQTFDTRLGKEVFVTDRTYASLDAIPSLHVVAPSFLPTWMVAYSYPQNVNRDGIEIAGIADEHNRVLPVPVFPTPLYETIICSVLFFILWAFRRRMKPAGAMLGFYFVVNGFERFFIEQIRVNQLYNFMGLTLSQAQWIAVGLMVGGIALLVWAYTRKS